MSKAHISPISLLGREVSFRDLAFERHLLDLDIPADYPEHLLSSVRTGQVTEFVIRLPLDGHAITEILVDDTYYDIADCDFLNLTLRTQ